MSIKNITRSIVLSVFGIIGAASCSENELLQPDPIKGPENLIGINNDGSNACSLFKKDPKITSHKKGTAASASWTDATERLGIPKIYSISASLGDVNNDGLPDIVAVDNNSSNLLINCGESFHIVDLEQRSSGEKIPGKGFFEIEHEGKKFHVRENIFSTYIGDVDIDGKMDLTIGSS